MSKIYFEVDDDVVIKRTPMPEIGENTYKTEVVMTKKIFQECYKKWIEPREREVKDLSERVENIENQMKEDMEERLKKLNAELEYAKFCCALKEQELYPRGMSN